MKKLIVTGFLFSTVIVTGFIACQTSSKSASSRFFKFNLEKGKEYHYEIVWDMKQNMMEQESNISFGSLYAMNVTEDDGKIKTMTGTYRRFNMSMSLMGMEINIDTDTPLPQAAEDIKDKNPIAMMKRIFSGIVGKSFSMKVDHEGNVLEVSGFREIFESMLNNIDMDEKQKAEGKAALEDQFNEQGVKDQFAQLFTIFPNKEIKTGDTWERSYTTGGKMPGKYTTHYTVKGIEGDHVTLAAETKIESNGDIKIKGSQTGDIIADIKSGMIVNAQYEQDIETTVMGMAIKMVGKGKVKGSLK